MKERDHSTTQLGKKKAMKKEEEDEGGGAKASGTLCYQARRPLTEPNGTTGPRPTRRCQRR